MEKRRSGLTGALGVVAPESISLSEVIVSDRALLTVRLRWRFLIVRAIDRLLFGIAPLEHFLGHGRFLIPAQQSTALHIILATNRHQAHHEHS
ncbi:hypothetical protein EFD55_11215 [Rhizobium pisi]|uniref:Uncharacterized protein n=1 Tax=Rhizobium pisi TaxID=574561 RepID=A0A3R9HHZ8_9HYPH|nr:hypothetical protein EFD55_11215 [Rhizobium pisi]